MTKLYTLIIRDIGIMQAGFWLQILVLCTLIALVVAGIVILIIFLIKQQRTYQRKLLREEEREKALIEQNIEDILGNSGKIFCEKLLRYVHFFVDTEVTGIDALESIWYTTTMRKHIANILYNDTAPDSDLIYAMKQTLRVYRDTK